MAKRACGKISVEGDELFYKVTGQGKPLLMIPGGGGSGDSFLLLADLLSEQYKVITYDRRANARSTANNPGKFSIAQQSRDVLAVLTEVGEESAFVFGNSSGGVIALDFVKKFPGTVIKAIIHEPPLANFANDPTKWLKFFDGCYQTALNKGSDKAAAKFGMGVTGRITIAPIFSKIKLKRYLKKEPIHPGEFHLSQKIANEIFIKQELIPITNYLPDIDALRKHKEKLIFAVGSWTLRKKVWFAEVSGKLSNEIGTEFIALPGSHLSFIDKAREWAELLKKYFV
jgi:pimeloyl-ACP methyl ester carboxylesterase